MEGELRRQGRMQRGRASRRRPRRRHVNSKREREQWWNRCATKKSL